MTLRRTHVAPIALVAAFLLVSAGCATDDEPAEALEAAETADAAPEQAGARPGIRVVDVAQAAAIHEDRPDNLVVLDVRTPDEFAVGHLDGAIMIDFYSDDFGAELAELDPDVPYLLYCRSGNRSGQTRALMADLGFADVADVGGGILAWTDAGLPVVAP